VTSANVCRITKSSDEFSVVLSDGRSFESSHLALAVPPPEASRLSEEIAPELSLALSRIKVETIETVGVAVLKEKLRLPPLAGIIPLNDDFYSAVSRDCLPHATYRGFSFHFKSGHLPLEGKLKRIAQVLRVSPEDLEQVVQRESRLPSPVVGHGSLTAEIDRSIAPTKLLVTGNYFAGLAIEDCIVRSTKEFARLSSRF
jgi:protoporphyrinogen oxidase